MVHADALLTLKQSRNDNSIDAIVTDPPYELGFMGKAWDGTGIAYSVEFWTECYRVLKPGGHLLAFGGTRTYHRMVCAIEDAGFEIRDSLHWIYGSGFPKSHDISKAIDKVAGATRPVVGTRLGLPGVSKDGANQANGYSRGIEGREDRPSAALDVTAPVTDDAKAWQGWGTALKPAHEPIVLARKPFVGTVAANVLEHGTGALNVDGCRVETAESWEGRERPNPKGREILSGAINGVASSSHPLGRWPANLLLDDEAAGMLDESRFFPVFKYQAKAPKRERPVVVTEDGRKVAHPTVKPLALMRWLVRLVTPPDGVVLDPFAGTGTTLEAAYLEGIKGVGIESDADSVLLIHKRMEKYEEKAA